MNLIHLVVKLSLNFPAIRYDCIFAQVSGVLSELHAIVRQIVVAACEDTLSQHGFVPDPLEDPADGNRL